MAAWIKNIAMDQQLAEQPGSGTERAGAIRLLPPVPNNITHEEDSMVPGNSEFASGVAGQHLKGARQA